MWCELLEEMQTGVMWFDDRRRLKYVNSAAANLLMCGPHRLEGMPFERLFPISRPRWMTDRSQTLHEQKMARPDGGQLQVTVTLTHIGLQRAQNAQGWLVEVWETGQHMQIREEEGRFHQYEAGTRMMRMLAHEVRNPLAGIYGASQLLSRQCEAEPRSRHLLEVIQTEVRRLQGLLDRMLGPRQQLSKAPHDIHAAIRHVLDALEGERPEGIALKLDYDPSIPEANIDFDAMVQVLINLIRNAWQAMSPGKGLLTLRTRVAHRVPLGSRVVPLALAVQVIDTGPGIPPALFDSIFYPMVTSKRNGSGLGLYVSQMLVRQHDGLIVANSEPGHTVFTVYLPLKTEAS